MTTHRSTFGSKVKRFLVDAVLEGLIPQRRAVSYLGYWARSVVQIRRPLIIGVTGSAGKSTTTAMIAAALSHPGAERIVGRVGYSVGNMNDDVGVPATLLRFDFVLEIPWHYLRRLAVLGQITLRGLRAMMGSYPKVMVLEFAACSTGHLHYLVTIARPSMCVVTTIGPAHLEILKTLEGVVHEKVALVRAVPPSGLVVLGQDHEYVARLELAACAPVVKVPGKGVELSRNITFAVCRHLGVPDETVRSALAGFKSLDGRLNRLELAGITVIDDTCNANPLSLRLALDTLAETATPGARRLAILGWMGELGEESGRYHKEIGAYARTRADVLIGIGDATKQYDPDHWFETSGACADDIASLLRANDCLLVKGSAAARMGEIVIRLVELAEEAEEAEAMKVAADLEGAMACRSSVSP